MSVRFEGSLGQLHTFLNYIQFLEQAELSTAKSQNSNIFGGSSDGWQN